MAKASEIVRQLQNAIDRHGDHEVCHTETHLSVDEVVFHMPCQAGLDDGDVPFFTIEQEPYVSPR